MSTPRILCVHESRSVLEQLRLTLAASGFQSVPASEGGDALQVLSQNCIGGIVLSYDMKAPDGRSLRVHIQHAHPDVPVLLFCDVDEIRNMPLHVFSAYLEDPECRE